MLVSFVPYASWAPYARILPDESDEGKAGRSRAVRSAESRTLQAGATEGLAASSYFVLVLATSVSARPSLYAFLERIGPLCSQARVTSSQ